MMTDQPSDLAVELSGIGKQVGSMTILHNISWTVPRGHITALLGLNGAGKTTLLRLLLGIVRPTAGRGRIHEYDLVTDAARLRQRVGYVGERSTMPGAFTPDRLERLGRAVFATWDSQAYQRALERFTIPRQKPVYRMSQGQRALTALAFALAHQADVLLLDEPTNGLDPLVRREFLTQLIEGAYDQGQTIILSSHRLEEVADMAQDIAILHQGRLVESGPLADLLERDQLVTLRVNGQIPDLTSIPGASRVDQDALQATIWFQSNGNPWPTS